jgi:hypothetical protein
MLKMQLYVPHYQIWTVKSRYRCRRLCKLHDRSMATIDVKRFQATVDERETIMAEDKRDDQKPDPKSLGSEPMSLAEALAAAGFRPATRARPL